MRGYLTDPRVHRRQRPTSELTSKRLLTYIGDIVVTPNREPDVIRVAPTPLYNRFEDVFTFSERLAQVLQEIS